MRKIREVLRLSAAGCSPRAIALSVRSALSTVQGCLRRARQAGVGWPLPEEMDDVQLEVLLYPPKETSPAMALPDFAHLQRELSRPGVTRQLLWQEYKAAHADGVGYTSFCVQYRQWLKSAEPVMRFEHRAGDKCFVDYAGHTIEIIDRLTGECHPAQIFVATLGCSNYTYAEASLSQSLPDWLGSHVRAFEFFGGVPQAIVPDNLKSAVTRAHRYDPQINPAYAELAQHYGVTILPARVRKPRDKAKVEGAVLIVERWVLARLRDRQFFSLAELNAAIAELLIEYNQRPLQKLDGSRHSRFVDSDRPALKALPARAYEYADWKVAKVHLDYHIEVGHSFYSVPHRYIGAQVELRITLNMVEIFYRRKLIATHIRADKRGKRRTQAAHRPERHRAVVDQSIERLITRAAHIDECVAQVLREQFNRKKHPEEALRAAQGILRMAQDYSARQLIAACQQACTLKAYSYRSIKHLIAAVAQRTVAQRTAAQSTSAKDSAVRSTTESDEVRQLSLIHDNVRGPDYYH